MATTEIATAPTDRAAGLPETESGTRLAAFARRLFEPINIGLLVYFRIAFGALMLWESTRYLRRDATGANWISQKFINPDVHFTYFGFDWIRPWSGGGMYWHFYLIGALALCVMLGFAYRAACVLFFLAFTYVFLLDQTEYLNHFYMISLVSLLMAFLPANRAFSIDAKLRPKIRSFEVPAWTLWILRFQLAVVYFYGGVAKMNWDWFQGEPMRMFLYSRAPLFPNLAEVLTSEATVMAFTWGGLLLDLLIVPFLLWRRTLVPAIIAAFVFHGMNNVLFQIGIFPWFMAFGTLLFCPPDWMKLTPPTEEQNHRSKTKPATTDDEDVPAPTKLSAGRKATLAFLAAYVLFQLLVPFRHHLYPGNVSWTEEGHRFSWHMKLRIKQVSSAEFDVVSADDRLLYTLFVDVQRLSDPRDFENPWTMVSADGREADSIVTTDEITNRQTRAMLGKPDMLLQFTKYLKRRFAEQGDGEVRIFARVNASLNGRRPQPLVDRNADLASIPRTLGHGQWIVPLTTPLRSEVPAGDEINQTGGAPSEGAPAPAVEPLDEP